MSTPGRLYQRPARHRPEGNLHGRGDNRELDEDKFHENLTDEVITKLIKTAEMNSEEYSVDEVGTI